jgi:hypothetical protein
LPEPLARHLRPFGTGILAIDAPKTAPNRATVNPLETMPGRARPLGIALADFKTLSLILWFFCGSLTFYN